MDAQIHSPPSPTSRATHSSGSVDDVEVGGAWSSTTGPLEGTGDAHASSGTLKERGVSHDRQSPRTKLRNNSNHGNPPLPSSAAAPYSSGTSDVDTSGNERISESTSDLSGLGEVPRPTTTQRLANVCNSTSSGDEGFKGAGRAGPKPVTSRKPPNLLQLGASGKPSLSVTVSGSARGLQHHAPSSPSLSARSTVSPGGASPDLGAPRSSNLSPSPRPKPPVAAKPANLHHMSGALSAPNLRKVTSFTYDEQTRVHAPCESTEGLSLTPPEIGQTPTGVNGGSITEHARDMGTRGSSRSPVENTSSASEAVGQRGVTIEVQEEKQPVFRKEITSGAQPTCAQATGAQPTGAQATGAQCAGAQATSDQRPSTVARPSHVAGKKPLPPRKSVVRGGSEDSASTPVAEARVSPRLAYSPTLTHSPSSSSDTSANSTVPLPKPAVLGRKPAVPAKPKIQQVQSTVLPTVSPGSLVEEPSSMASSSKRVESEGVLQDGSESKPGVPDMHSSEPVLQDESAVDGSGSESVMPSDHSKPALQSGSCHATVTQSGHATVTQSGHTTVTQSDNLSQTAGVTATNPTGERETNLPVTPVPQDSPSPRPGVRERKGGRGETGQQQDGADMSKLHDPAMSQPPPTTSSSPTLPAVDQREQSSPGGPSSSPSSNSSSQESRVSPVLLQKASTIRRSPHVGVCIASHSSPTPDLGSLSGRRHPESSTPPPLSSRDNLASVSVDDALSNLPLPHQELVLPFPPPLKETGHHEGSERRLKQVKRFQLREDEGGGEMCAAVPRTSSASSAPKRHYDEVELVATIPRKDNGSRRAAPPKPPKTYATDEGSASSPCGTPPSALKNPFLSTLERTANVSTSFLTVSSSSLTSTVQLRHPETECAPPPLPSAPIPRKKDRINSYKRACDSPSGGSQRSSHLRRQHDHPLSHNETASGSKSSLTSNEGSDPSLGEMEPYYESVQSQPAAGLEERAPTDESQVPAHWLERYDVSDNFRKSWSGQMKQSVTASDCVSRSNEDMTRERAGSLQRATSLDSLNGRVGLSNKIVYIKDTDDSSDEGIISPSEPGPTAPVGLPEVPKTWSTPKVCVCGCGCVHTCRCDFVSVFIHVGGVGFVFFSSDQLFVLY